MEQTKKHIIYFHGHPGSGKSSTADQVAEALGYERMSAGVFFREEAGKRSMSLVEFNQYIQTHPETDIEVDQKQKRYIENNDKLVFDGRLGFYLAPKIIFNVFLDLDTETAAKRILTDKVGNPGRKSEVAHDLADMVKELKERAELERRKLEQLYGVKDCFDKNNFDLVVDTGPNNLEKVTNIVIDAYKKWLER